MSKRSKLARALNKLKLPKDLGIEVKPKELILMEQVQERLVHVIKDLENQLEIQRAMKALVDEQCLKLKPLSLTTGNVKP